MTGQDATPRSSARQFVRPFFEKALGNRAEIRRLLLLTYHFPPGDATGALRWQKLCVLGWEHGFHFDVITLDPAGLGKRDVARLEELPAGTRVYGITTTTSFSERMENAIWSLYKWIKNKVSGQANKPSSFPHAGSSQTSMPLSNEAGSINTSGITWSSIFRSPRSGCRRLVFSWIEHTRQASWAKAARVKALQLSSDHEYAAVVTCGPPHMVHEAGRAVAIKRGIPLVIDMRDPWSLVQRVPEALGSPLWMTLARYYERRVMRVAALVVTNTESHRVVLQKVYPDVSSRIVAVMNGYDDEKLPASTHVDTFTIAYAGGIYLDRDPRNLFAAVGKVVKELGLSPEDLSVELMGDVTSYGGIPTMELGRQVGIDRHLKLMGPQPRQAALELLSKATVLVNLPQDSDMAIPSKIFEYMQFDSWILAIAEPGSAVDLLLRDSDADLVEGGNIDKMAQVLRRRYLQFRSGERPKKLASNIAFSRKEQARKLFQALMPICGTRYSSKE